MRRRFYYVSTKLPMSRSRPISITNKTSASHKADCGERQTLCENPSTDDAGRFARDQRTWKQADHAYQRQRYQAAIAEPLCKPTGEHHRHIGVNGANAKRTRNFECHANRELDCRSLSRGNDYLSVYRTRVIVSADPWEL